MPLLGTLFCPCFASPFSGAAKECNCLRWSIRLKGKVAKVMSNRTSNLPSRVTDVNVIVESGSLGIRHDAAGPREQAREETSSTEPLIPSATNQEFGLHNPDAAACDIQPPTVATYNEFQEAYSYFNESLFDRTLPDCLITLAHQAGSYGYFRCEPFVNRDGERTDEISLNPRFFASRTDRGVLSTLVHEMAHLEQSHFGKPGRTGYHNRQWANKMIHLGLYPSNTGQPGGRETGYSMTHYIVAEDCFPAASICPGRKGNQSRGTARRQRRRP
jgi:hypothetical protein